MNDHVTSAIRNAKETKGALLNKIVEDLMANCDTIEAVIIADWQGFSFASKLPKDVNEDEISATTLFTLEGAEGTRRELEKSLLGHKLSYLMMVTEKGDNLAYMFVFPIETLGYIASISCAREDIALIVQNMKIAAEKAAKILVSPEDKIKEENIEPKITSKYKSLLQKLETLKSVKISFLEPQIACSPSQEAAPMMHSQTETPDEFSLQPPPLSGPPAPPTAPLEFIEVETEFETIDTRSMIPPEHLAKFQIVFYDSKRIKYTVTISAVDELDAQVKLQEMEQYHPIEIINVTKIG